MIDDFIWVHPNADPNGGGAFLRICSILLVEPDATDPNGGAKISLTSGAHLSVREKVSAIEKLISEQDAVKYERQNK